MAKTILLLDDDRSNLDVLTAILRARGFQVIGASSSKEAMDAAQQESPIDLLVLDVSLKGDAMSGTETAVALTHSRGTLPVVFVTGSSLDYWDEGDRRNLGLLPAGTFEILEKPFLPAALESAIQRLMSREPGTRVQVAGSTAPRQQHTLGRM